MADNSKPPVVEVQKFTVQSIMADNQNKELWRWITVPDEDLFGVEHTGVSINFEKYGPGRHFVCPEAAEEIERLIKLRLRGDMRVLQPKQDAAMAKIMQKSQLGAATNPSLKGLNDA
jgi:hypothetical protein